MKWYLIFLSLGFVISAEAKYYSDCQYDQVPMLISPSKCAEICVARIACKSEMGTIRLQVSCQSHEGKCPDVDECMSDERVTYMSPNKKTQDNNLQETNSSAVKAE